MNKLNKFFPLLVSVALAASLAAPAVTLAKENNGKHKGVTVSAAAKVKVEHKSEQNEQGENEQNEKGKNSDNNQNSGACWRAFGHLIAPGWIKNFGHVQFNADCFLPFGIAKKLGIHNGTTTPPVIDTTAPVISSIAVQTGVNSATITWQTNEKSDSKVYWNTINPLDINASTTLSVSSGAKVLSHSLNLTGLTASTTYYAIVQSRDAAGNVATSSQLSFTTAPVVVVPDTTPPAISNAVAVVGTSTISVGWLTNENATGRVYYSTSTPVATSTASFVENTSLTLSHLLNISGLSTSTTYHLIIESKDSAGNTSLSSEFGATTGI